ncbi:uncharacterized protein RSE6_07585 [Rhynchosporium secalis]|uniref:TEA domain-containing protein n=1 Tax=Rhynchosporium secalis TaxID=38038 RepID=A0A1E1MDB1_RHYSE|nr:uncharacterized protein RSE6_07585 [Rhynchosporium secalis]
MDYRRRILPTDYTLHLPLDNPSEVSRTRQPLSDSAGNAQHHSLASAGLYHDSKGHHMYSIPTVPSQPHRQSVGQTLEVRRQGTRRQRQLRFNRNPIVECAQYQAYRNRQNREGSDEDKIWPDVLEDAFLDALMYLPRMGRMKFSYEGKPHGRNELIRVYLWLSYLKSLPPGARPNHGLKRTRKQVSSHIQVLKNLFKEHPAYHHMFPPPSDPKNGFEDSFKDDRSHSFKDDPCLQALSQGRLPTNMYGQFEQQSHVVMTPTSPMRPVLFWLLMTSSSISFDDCRRDVHEEDLNNEGLVAHKFSRLSMQRQRDSLESIPSWRQRFPLLQQLSISDELDCEIVHMEASLNLLTNQPPEGSELCSRMVLAMPGRQHDTEWRIVTTLSKPPELYRDQISDPPLQAQAFAVDVKLTDNGETRIKVPFPASPWAQAFSCLQSIQSKFEEKQENSFNTGMGSTRPAREYVESISMYQEVQSAPGPDSPFVRRSIILWTFRQASSSERNGTTWRYLDSAPLPRRMCMSPSPHSSHQLHTSMNENFNSWSNTPLQLQHSSMHEPFVQGLATPPHTAGPQSPLFPPSYGYSQSYDMPSENLSFISNTNTIDSDSTLVDNDVAANIDNFLTNSHHHLNSFEQASSQGWQLPNAENFDVDPSWTNYTVPTTTPALGWDSAEAKTHAWPDLPLDGKSWDHHIIEGTGDKEWTEEISNSPVKGSKNYIEQSIEQKLLPWNESHRSPADIKQNYDQLTVDTIPEIINHESENLRAENKDLEWQDDQDEFDYAALAERLK